MMKTWENWCFGLRDGILGVSDAELRRAAEVVLRSDLVLVAGNGGSSALASHAAQAFAKPSYGPGGGRAAVCLSDNVPLLTSHANDGGWEDALVECARPYVHAVRLVSLVVFSSSGKSENVVRLVRLFRDRFLPVVAFTGFEGEPLRSLASVSLHVDSDDYEVVEPVHDALLHRVQYHVREAGQECGRGSP